MKNILSSEKVKFLLITILIISIVFNLGSCGIIYAADTNGLKNITRMYFYSEITKDVGAGDCILLENYDQNGVKHYGLIDAGNKRDANGKVVTSVKNFLKKHGVTKLEFFMITHNHTDHHGDALDVIDNFQIDKIFMNLYDKKFSSNQEDPSIYENTIKKAIAKNIRVFGVSYGAIRSTTISPSISSSFIQSTANAKESNFIEFNNNTTKNITFGSAKIQIFNWELFDKNGNKISVKKTGSNKWEYITEKGITSTREVIPNENYNSLGLLLTQGNKKAFFAGDMNNNEKKAATSTTPERLGDEDRIKDAVGKVDLLKLGHHGNTESSTQGFINVLKPEYAVISNEMGRAHKDITDWLKKDKVKYIYTTQDKYEVSATLTNDIVFFGLGTDQTINKINDIWKYTPKGAKYKNYESRNNSYEVVSDDTTTIKVNANSWEALKTAINNNRNNEARIDDSEKKYYIHDLVVNLQKGGNWTANSEITIEKNQRVILTSSENITITRGSNLNNAPLFLVKGNLSIGNSGMEGTITIDGNKSNVTSSATLINVDLGDLSLYNNVKLCNNFNKATTLTKKLGSVDYYVAFGSAIFARNGNIYMYGGEISDNSQKIACELELPMESSRSYYLSTMGAGVYLESASKLNMYGGSIINNKASNNSVVKTNSKYSNITGSIKQQCLGVGVYADRSSEVNLIKGKIQNNKADNNSVLQVNTSTVSGKTTTIKKTDNSIYGVGVYTGLAYLNMTAAKPNDFTVSGNYASKAVSISLQKNTKIESSATSCVIGLQACADGSVWNINGGTISGGAIDGGNPNSNLKISKQGAIGSAGTSSVFTVNTGGGLQIGYGSKATINNLTINKCESSDRGGGIYVTSSNVTISNSNITENKASHGGGMFIANETSKVNIIDSKFNGNKATPASGGGIYTYGKLTIKGQTEISGNEAGYAGGGICINAVGEVILNDGKIINNHADKTGGGIQANGKVTVNGGTISGNTADTLGGGIRYFNNTLVKNGGTISNNIAQNEVSNIYPVNKNIVDDLENQNPTEGQEGQNPTEGQEGQNPSEGQEGQNPTEGQKGQNPSEGQENQNPSEGQESQNPTEGQKGKNPTEGQEGQNPTEGQEGQNPSEGQEGQNPTEGQKGQNPSDGQENQNPSEGKEGQNPSEGQEGQNPTEGQESQNPTEGQKGQNPSEGQEGQNPSEGQESQNPTEGQKGQNPSEGQEGQNPSEGQESQNPSEGQNPTEGQESQIKSYNLLDYKIEGIVPTYYTGKNVELNISITNGNTKLTKNVNYKLTYVKNKDIGEATVRIDGIGGFKGSIIKTFKIIKKPSIDTGKEYFITSVISNGRAIDVKNGKLQNGNNMIIYTLNCGDSQRIKLIKNNDESYYLQNSKSQNYLEVANNNTSKKGENVLLTNSINNSPQKWYIGQNTDGTLSFYTSEGLVLETSGEKNNSNIVINSTNNSAAQKFKIRSTEELSAVNINSNKYYCIVSSINYRKAVDVYAGRKDNFTNISIYDLNRTDAQKYRFEKNDDGSYTIINKGSSKAVDVYANRTVNMTNVDIYTSNKTSAQKWNIIKNSDGTITILGLESGKALDLYAANVKNFTNIHIWDWNQTNAQKWKLAE